MKRPIDNDIFGTKNVRNMPKIQNDLPVDPHAFFKAKMQTQYNQYANTVNQINRTISHQQTNNAKVNQEAQFDEYYHHSRKQADMKSSIFSNDHYGQESRVTERMRLTQRNIPKHANEEEANLNYGRKQTLAREVKNLPENKTDFKGNCSSVFGYDTKQDRNDIKNNVEKLIPCGMQWDQHDSIRYEGQTPYNIDVVESRVFSSKEKKLDPPSNEEKKENQPLENKVKEEKKIKEKNSNNVEISIIKGWNPNLLESLSKYCKVNSTKIVSVEFEEGGKGTLTINKSKRWEVITDWLRKDAKLKIKVK